MNISGPAAVAKPEMLFYAPGDLTVTLLYIIGLSSPKIEMGGKALKWLSRLDYPLAKTGETVNGGAESAVHLDR